MKEFSSKVVCCFSQVRCVCLSKKQTSGFITQAGHVAADRGFVDRMPSFMSLVTGPPQKRQRCLKFHTSMDQEKSSQEYSDQSPSASFSQQESRSNAGHPTEPQSQAVSASHSEQADDPCSTDNDSCREVSVKQEPTFTASRRQATQVRPSSRQQTVSSGAVPALAAAMGSHMPSAARSAASHAAAAAAAMTPVSSRHVSPHSGAANVFSYLKHCREFVGWDAVIETRHSFSCVTVFSQKQHACIACICPVQSGSIGP